MLRANGAETEGIDPELVRTAVMNAVIHVEDVGYRT